MKNRYLFICLLTILGLIGCFEDDSTLGTKSVPDITIAELADTAIVSYSGNILNVNPEVETLYPESELSYAWYYYPEEGIVTASENKWKDGYHNYKIGEGRELSYEVNLPSGSYAIIFEVTSKTNNYVATQKFRLKVTTEFSSCFYVLKEIAEGNSDLDLVKGEEINPNIISNMYGEAILGKPLNLSYIYNQGYIDEAAGGSAGAKAMYVFTDKDTRAYNTEDMAEIITRNTLSYSPLPQGETPCTAFCAFVLMMLTDDGFYYTQPYDADMGYTSASRYGMSTGVGGSPWVMFASGTTSWIYWSQAEHHVYLTDVNGSTPSPIEYEMPAGVDETSLICIAGGQNWIGGTETSWFLTENPSGIRYLYLLNASGQVDEIRKVAANSHLAKAEIVAANGLSAPALYVVDNNELYLYYFESGLESRIQLPGVGSDEKITYVSNQYLNGASAGKDDSFDFDALLVATQKEGNYRLYCFEDFVGGIPQKAVSPAVGEGSVKNVRYAAPLSFSIFDYIFTMSGPIFPLCD